MGINLHQFCDRSFRRQWVQNYHDMHGSTQKKMIVLVPLYEIDAQTVASRFLAEVISHHWMLATMISDRDPGSKKASRKSYWCNKILHHHLVQPPILHMDRMVKVNNHNYRVGIMTYTCIIWQMG